MHEKFEHFEVSTVPKFFFAFEKQNNPELLQQTICKILILSFLNERLTFFFIEAFIYWHTLN